MLRIEETINGYCIYTGNIQSLKNRVGKLCFGIENKLDPVKWIFKPLEGQDRDSFIVHPISLSFLTEEEVNRMKIKLSSTKIRAGIKKDKERNDRMRRHTEYND